MEPNQQTYKSYHAQKRKLFSFYQNHIHKFFQVWSSNFPKVLAFSFLLLHMCTHYQWAKPIGWCGLLGLLCQTWSWHPKEGLCSWTFSCFFLSFLMGFGIILLFFCLTMHCLVSPIPFFFIIFFRFFFNEKIV